jgi:hypothetical protein
MEGGGEGGKEVILGEMYIASTSFEALGRAFGGRRRGVVGGVENGGMDMGGDET